MINGSQLRDAIVSAAYTIANQKQKVDELNVFPVPDGDTGTNMSMTIGAATRELELLKEPTVSETAKVAASALLRGARGNSGVILSLLFRGFSKGMKGKVEATGVDFAEALSEGVAAAYKAVMKPTEGTILTVAREAAEKAQEVANQTNDALTVFRAIVAQAEETLLKTPEMLPVLKKAGVVDAGGKGFTVIFGAMLAVFEGGPVARPEAQAAAAAPEAPKPRRSAVAEASGDIKNTYCTEFIVEKAPNAEDPEIPFGFVAGAAGQGVSSLFTDLGVNNVVTGGQTMNPSTDDILRAIHATPAQTVFVLPNNKIIIMAAEQAVKLADRRVCVLQTVSIPQGISAMLAFDPDASFNDNQVLMTEAFSRVQTGQITFAARDSDFDGHNIKAGEILALENGKLSFVEKDLTKALYKLTRSLVRKDSSFITVLYGADVTDDQAQEACELLKSKLSANLEVNLINGGQPVYYYIVSVE